MASSLKPTSSKVKNYTKFPILRKNKQRRRRGKKGIANFSNKLKPSSKGSNRLRKLMKYGANDSFTSHTASTPFIA